MKYRIWASHCGDPSEIIETFDANNDDDARKKLRNMEKNPNYGMDYLWMERIDVAEKTTYVG